MAGRPPSEVVRCHSTRRELATCVLSACAIALSTSPRTASATADSISARAVLLRPHHTPLQPARDTSSDARIADLPSFITPNTAPSTPSPPSPARTACPSRGMQLSRWQGAPGPALAYLLAGRACPIRSGSVRRAVSYQAPYRGLPLRSSALRPRRRPRVHGDM